MKDLTLYIDCKKIQHNASVLTSRLNKKGILITGVSKSFLGTPAIIKALEQAGINDFVDSRLETIKKMRDLGIQASLGLIRSPCLSQVADVIELTNYSYQSELKIIEELSHQAQLQGKSHGVIVMIEMGDLRDGLMPLDLESFVKKIKTLPNLILKGIGTNMFCLNQTPPKQKTMYRLSGLANKIETTFGSKLEIVSGGNSANLNWAFQAENTSRINNLRLGEAILLGKETLFQKKIPDLHLDAFTLEAQVIETKKKPSHPQLDFNQASVNEWNNEINWREQSILNFGKIDVDPSGLNPEAGMKIINYSSDHLVLSSTYRKLKLGDKVSFSLNYDALSRAFISPFVKKLILQ